MDGWDWLWMTFGMGSWIVLIGTVVYLAVRLATRLPRRRHQQHQWVDRTAER